MKYLKRLAWELVRALNALYNQLISSGCIYLKTRPESSSRQSTRRATSMKLVIPIECGKHLFNHLKHHNLFMTLQHGFMRAQSCESQVLLTLNDLSCSPKPEFPDGLQHPTFLLRLRHHPTWRSGEVSPLWYSRSHEQYYKDVKKILRKVSRVKMQNILDTGFNSIKADCEKKKTSWTRIK